MTIRSSFIANRDEEAFTYSQIGENVFTYLSCFKLFQDRKFACIHTAFFRNNNDEFHQTTHHFQRDHPPDESMVAHGDDRSSYSPV